MAPDTLNTPVSLMDVWLCVYQAPDSDVFQGFIRVHMNLHKPISMAIAPPRARDVTAGCSVSDDVTAETEPFYLPANTSKVIHITRSVYNVSCMNMTSPVSKKEIDVPHTVCYTVLCLCRRLVLSPKAFRSRTMRVSVIIY